MFEKEKSTNEGSEVVSQKSTWEKVISLPTSPHWQTSNGPRICGRSTAL